MKQTSRIKLRVAATKAAVLFGGIIGIWLLVVVLSLTLGCLSNKGWMM